MRTQYQTHIVSNQTSAVSLSPETFGNMIALNGLCERDNVRYLQMIVAEMYPQTLGVSALDLNAGRGVTAMALAEMGLQVAAFDMHRNSISILQKIAMHQELNISFGRGGVLHLEELNKKFDLIHDADCLNSLPSITDRTRFLKGVKNTLADDGKVVIMVKVQSANYIPEDSFESVRLDNENILWRQTPESNVAGVVALDGKHWVAQKYLPSKAALRQELEAAGFQILVEDLEVVPGNNPSLLRLVLTISPDTAAQDLLR